MEYALAALIGVISSLTASVVFLLVLSKLRPRLEISDKIAWTMADNRKEFHIKIINRTKNPIVNIKTELLLAKWRNVSGGRIYSSMPIELRQSEALQISGFTSDPEDNKAEYAIRFTALEDIDQLWANDENTSLIFRVYGVHSISNLGRAFQRTYHRKATSLKYGDFKFGNSLEIE